MAGIARFAAIRQPLEEAANRFLSSELWELLQAVAPEGSHIRPPELVLFEGWKEPKKFPLGPRKRAVLQDG